MNDEHELYERIAKLEEENRHMEMLLGKLFSQQEQIMRDLQRYKGFWGGVSLIGTSAFIFITLFWEWLTSKM